MHEKVLEALNSSSSNEASAVDKNTPPNQIIETEDSHYDSFAMQTKAKLFMILSTVFVSIRVLLLKFITSKLTNYELKTFSCANIFSWSLQLRCQQCNPESCCHRRIYSIQVLSDGTLHRRLVSANHKSGERIIRYILHFPEPGDDQNANLEECSLV